MMLDYITSGSSSSSLTTEERARAEVFADAECDRIQPRNRAAYRAAVLARRSAEIITERDLSRAFQARLIDTVVTKLEAIERQVVVTPEEARRSRELMLAGINEARGHRSALLDQMRAEQGSDPSWHTRAR